MISVLLAKLQKVKVTESNINYRGSVTIDLDLMDKLGVVEYQQCIINGKENRDNITYVIAGERGSGCVEMNGALSTKHKKGDEVHILFFGYVNNYVRHKPAIVITDGNNKFEKYINK
jgi:aspartate 1-decarboxylase